MLRYRVLVALMVLLGLLLPFVLQQTFYPFFRFGMFAEPVTREIQQEVFRLEQPGLPAPQLLLP